MASLCVINSQQDYKLTIITRFYLIKIKVLRESVKFGINQDSDVAARFWANFNDIECRMLV